MALDYGVDLGRLDSVTEDLRRTQVEMERQLKTLDGLVAGLQDVWRGQAATAQQHAHAVWSKEAHDMHTALVQLQEAAKLAHSNYSSAVDTNLAMWKQVR
jgi:WXG100 family type VII secretion target